LGSFRIVWILPVVFVLLPIYKKRSADLSGFALPFLFHLGEYFLVVLVRCLDTVLYTSVP
jgi:hypothetical protein